MKLRLFSLLILLGTLSHAKLSKELLGEWTLNEEATKKELRSQKKWQEADEKMLPKVLGRMSSVTYSVTNKAVNVLVKGNLKMTFPVTGESKENDHKVIETTVISKGEEVKITLTFIQKGKNSYIIKSNKTNDMDHYIWSKK